MNTPTLKVKTTQPTKTRESGIILPAGTIGQVIQYERKQKYWFKDFGLMTVISLPVDSPPVKIVGVSNES